MTKKYTQNTLDPSIQWKAIGIDLAKYDNTVVAVSQDGEVQHIERIINR